MGRMMPMKRLQDLTEPELRSLMNTLARKIEATADECHVERPLFALILFNDPKIGQYIGNCQRADMVAALRETADRLERRLDVPR
jgi:hypothetical protein